MMNLDLGNHLNRVVRATRGFLFRQSELAQLTFGAFDIAYRRVQEDQREEIELQYPVGWTADQKPIPSTRKYSKQELLTQYQFLAADQLSQNGILHLVTIMEAMAEDLLRAVYLKYPEKLGADKKINIGAVLQVTSLEALRAHAVDTVLNENAYSSPKEHARAIRKLMGINLLECTAFHRYIELKATRDVYIHNRGYANKTYIRKAGQHSRVKEGDFLPANAQYFHESFEQCVQLTEWWEEVLHKKWHSSEYENRLTSESRQDVTPSQPTGDAVSEQLRLLAAKYASPTSIRSG